MDPWRRDRWRPGVTWCPRNGSAKLGECSSYMVVWWQNVRKVM
jgi:hypothetical protein